MYCRWILGMLIAALPCATQLRERQEVSLELPTHMRDEDESVPKQTEYAFNPIQARKEVRIGDFYARKGNHHGAAARYLEATRWNPSYAKAFWKLGRVRQELDEPKVAAKAYQKYLNLKPEGKRAKDARKHLAEIGKKAKLLTPSTESTAGASSPTAQ